MTIKLALTNWRFIFLSKLELLFNGSKPNPKHSPSYFGSPIVEGLRRLKSACEFFAEIKLKKANNRFEIYFEELNQSAQRLS